MKDLDEFTEQLVHQLANLEDDKTGENVGLTPSEIMYVATRLHKLAEQALDKGLRGITEETEAEGGAA